MQEKEDRDDSRFRMRTISNAAEFYKELTGNYTSDSLSSLIWTVFKHRCHHLFKGEGWRD